MPRRGENIYKRKDGRWEGRYIKNHTADTKAKYGYVYGKTYSEVKEKLIRAKAVPNSSVSEPKTKTISLNEVLTLWLSSVQRNVKEATYARYYHLVEAHSGNVHSERTSVKSAKKLRTSKRPYKSAMSPKS